MTENEALEVDANWKLPCLLCFVQTEADKKNTGSFFKAVKELNFAAESRSKFGA